jgi:hypothetical protein
VSELDPHSSSPAHEAHFGASPNSAVSDEKQQVDFAADRQRTSRFDVPATQAHIAKKAIVDRGPVVDLGPTSESCRPRPCANAGANKTRINPESTKVLFILLSEESLDQEMARPSSYSQLGQSHYQLRISVVFAECKKSARQTFR